MKILIIKTSSMGDIIHTLPAVTDLAANKKDISIDWAVEAAFAEIPRWHPHVHEVIPIHLRQLRKQPLHTLKSGELREFIQNLRKKRYDVILDAQGLIKSALCTKLAHGTKSIGLDAKSAREPLASFFYDEKIAVAKNQHAIIRLRQLFAAAFNYPLTTDKIHYGLSHEEFLLPIELSVQGRYLVFLHGTTWLSKHWPQNHWKQLATLAIAAGFEIFLPWGTDQEYANAREISQGLPQAHILPRLSLTELAAVLLHAHGVVSVDSGLGHLACALSVPVVGLYGASNHQLTGMSGEFTATLSSDLQCAPCLQPHCRYSQPDTTTAPECLSTLTPNLVLKTLTQLMQSKNAVDGDA